jgi:peptidoglycan/xylan/chitin deacetylase (PgdA/CDA1 family)
MNEGRAFFRNDDVSWDTSLQRFREFCAVFHKYQLTQIHGVVLRGRTNSAYWHAGRVAEYEGFDSIGRLNNIEIRRLSEGLAIEQHVNLIRFLNAIPDEVALHGLYHTDYSTMSAEEQDQDMTEGLALMRSLFPQKCIRLFIAPFNKTNAATYEIAARNGLTVSAAEGIHLEEQLNRLVVKPGEWYRYHHHRFYPESKFTYYDLSVKKLDDVLGRNVGVVARQPSFTKRLAKSSWPRVSRALSAAWRSGRRHWPFKSVR